MKLGSFVDLVIQANGRLSFEDILSSWGLLYCVSQWTSIHTELVHSMVNWLARYQKKRNGGCWIHPAFKVLKASSSVVFLLPVNLHMCSVASWASRWVQPQTKSGCKTLLSSELLDTSDPKVFGQVRPWDNSLGVEKVPTCNNSVLGPSI